MSTHIERTISITGLGYVGLPVAVAFSKIKPVIGFDIDKERINELISGIDKTGEVSNSDLNSSNIKFTSDEKELSKANFHIITVPTPVDDENKPDLRCLLLASKIIGKILKKGDIVVYESTVYPGATEDECAAVLINESGLQCGEDFFLGYSPERINPGDKNHTFEKVSKVVSAQDDTTLKIIADIYSLVLGNGVYKAPSIKVAEAAKIIENTQRDLNIALVNELAILFDKMGIDTHEVLQAASTKWNFLQFVPGLVGGHCIGVDPYYLTYKSALLGYSPQVILAGRNINNSVGKYIANRVIAELIKTNNNLNNIIITVLGITFKENVSDIRNTGVMGIMEELNHHNINTQIHDPCANSLDVENEYQLVLTEHGSLKKSDAVILAVPHNDFIKQGWNLIHNLLNDNTGIVYDVKGVLDRNKKPEKINLLRL